MAAVNLKSQAQPKGVGRPHRLRYAGYNRLTGPGRKGGAPLRLAFCWSHARRRFREIHDSSGSEIAAEGLRRIAGLYAIEAEIRGSSAERRLAERQARSAPLVKVFGDPRSHRRQPPEQPPRRTPALGLQQPIELKNREVFAAPTDFWTQ